MFDRKEYRISYYDYPCNCFSNCLPSEKIFLVQLKKIV